MRRSLVRFFTFLGGLYFFLEFFLPASLIGPDLGAVHDDISSGLIAVGGMALGLGLINILVVHGARVVHLRKGWFYSIALLSGLFSMIFVTSWDWYRASSDARDAARFFNLREFSERIVSDFQSGSVNHEQSSLRSKILLSETTKLLGSTTFETAFGAPSPDINASIEEFQGRSEDFKASLERVSHPEHDLSDGLKDVSRRLGELGALRLKYLTAVGKSSYSSELYNLMYVGLFTALAAAMFSLLGFYIPAAAYRAFKVRSTESALMMGAAFVVMLGQIPFGIWLWDGFPELRAWLLSVPSAAAFRAIKIGAGVAGLVLAYRMWFSIESENFSAHSELKGGSRD